VIAGEEFEVEWIEVDENGPAVEPDSAGVNNSKEAECIAPR
jgi:hypothetical protein